MTGQYYQPPPQPQPQYGPQPVYRTAEADSIKTMVNIASIFGILLALVFILVAIWGIWAFSTVETYTDYYGNTYSTGLGAIVWVYIILGVLGAIFGFLFFMQCRGIKDMVERGQYVQAKSKTLIWMIIGIIFVGLIPGILLLIAYLKFDPLINATRGYGPAPQPQYQQPYLQAPPPQQYPPQQQQQGQYPPPPGQ